MITDFKMIYFKRLSVAIFMGLVLGLIPGFGGQSLGVFQPAYAQEAKLVVQGSGLPVPRFVTLKSNEVNMRVGPGQEYPKSWVYRRKGLPLKVIAEFDVWRKVIDHEETTGWVHSQLVTLKRNALIKNRLTKLHKKPDADSPVIAVAEEGVLMELQTCDLNWCRLANDDLRAYARRDDIWGILENETLN